MSWVKTWIASSKSPIEPWYDCIAFEIAPGNTPAYKFDKAVKTLCLYAELTLLANASISVPLLIKFDATSLAEKLLSVKSDDWTFNLASSDFKNAQSSSECPLAWGF